MRAGSSPGWVPKGSRWRGSEGGQAAHLESIGTHVNFLCVHTKTNVTQKTLVVFKNSAFP